MTTSTQTQSAGGGIGFAGLLTIVFIVLKLTGIIAWSWWWVLSPIWISVGVGILFFLGALIIIGLFQHNVEKRFANRQKRGRDLYGR